MSANLTYINDSLPHPPPSSFNPFYPFNLFCVIYKPGCWLFTSISSIYILLLLPLCSLILRHGFHQWRKRRPSSFSSSSSTSTHSDTFTYHLVTMELIHIFACITCICGTYVDQFLVLIIWSYLFTMTYYVETFFHVLTCVEHYLAVVHPVTYLRLRGAKWIRVRDVAVGCIWLLCLALTCVLLSGNGYITVDLCLSIVSVITISFCSLSVLQALIHPGPWDQGKDRVRIHQSKKRAFYTIVAILAVLLLRCMFLLVCTVRSLFRGWTNECVLTLSVVWVNLPASLVVPLLYLHRTGMLACLQKNA